jgi:hypothetical protein
MGEPFLPNADSTCDKTTDKAADLESATVSLALHCEDAGQVHLLACPARSSINPATSQVMKEDAVWG